MSGHPNPKGFLALATILASLFIRSVQTKTLNVLMFVDQRAQD